MKASAGIRWTPVFFGLALLLLTLATVFMNTPSLTRIFQWDTPSNLSLLYESKLASSGKTAKVEVNKDRFPGPLTDVTIATQFVLSSLTGQASILRTNSEGVGVAINATEVVGQSFFHVDLFLGKTKRLQDVWMRLRGSFLFRKTYNLVVEIRGNRSLRVLVDGKLAAETTTVSESLPDWKLSEISCGAKWSPDSSIDTTLLNTTIQAGVATEAAQRFDSKIIAVTFLISAIFFCFFLIFLFRERHIVFERPYEAALFLTVVGTLVVLALQWVNTFYLQRPAIEILSLRGEDSSWMPPGTLSVPLIGVHHFGDFQLMEGWAQWNDPYYLDMDLPSNMFPLSIVFFVVLNFFVQMVHGTSLLGFLIVTGLTLTLIIWPLVELLRKGAKGSRTIFFAFFVFLSMPFLLIVDRGNVQGLVIGFICLFWWAYENKRYVIASLALSMAIGFKAYPVFLLLIPLFDKRFRFVFGTLSTVFLVSLIPMIFFGDGFLTNLKGLVTGLKLQVGPSYLLSGISLAGLLRKLLYLVIPSTSFDALVPFIVRINFVPGIIYVAMVVFIGLKRRVPNWVTSFLVLSLLQMIVPTSMVYTASWMFLGVYVLYAGEKTVDSDLNTFGVVRMNLLYAFAIVAVVLETLAIPGTLEVFGKGVHIYEILAPLSVLSFCLVAFLISISSKERDVIGRVPVENV
jgi:Glycosyltransferase family 87